MTSPERLSFALGQQARFRTYGETTPGAPAAPDAGSGTQRRLADVINDAFRVALVRGDVVTAAELVDVLQGLHERDQSKTVSDRRRRGSVLDRARQDLAAKRAARYSRF